MKWSPPHIEHCRWIAPQLLLILAALTGLSSGCSALPVLQQPASTIDEAAQSVTASPYTAEEKDRMAEMPRVPLFDLPNETAKTSGPRPVVSSLDSPKMDTSPSKPPAVVSAVPKGILVTPPKPFSWQQMAVSTGNRPFLTATIGEDGYRTLVVGSIGGNDPIALELVDQLTRHLHEDSVIIGGFESTVIRTLNPDGEANRKFLNQKDQYINHGFPRTGETAAADQPVEVSFLLERLQQLQPQRVLHIRTVQGETGLIASSASCQTVAKEAADWLKFKLVNLPDKAVAGSMERYLAAKGSCDMITLAIPENSKTDALWNLYGDTLLNLLLGDDFATREVARKQAQQSSADRRNQSPGK